MRKSVKFWIAIVVIITLGIVTTYSLNRFWPSITTVLDNKPTLVHLKNNSTLFSAEIINETLFVSELKKIGFFKSSMLFVNFAKQDRNTYNRHELILHINEEVIPGAMTRAFNDNNGQLFMATSIDSRIDSSGILTVIICIDPRLFEATNNEINVVNQIINEELHRFLRWTIDGPKILDASNTNKPFSTVTPSYIHVDKR